MADVFICYRDKMKLYSLLHQQYCFVLKADAFLDCHLLFNRYENGDKR